MKIVFTLQNICIPNWSTYVFLFNTNISIPFSPNAPNAPNAPNDSNAPTSELNLPSIALRLSLGLNRLRLSIVYIGISSAFGLHDFPLLHRAVKFTHIEW